MAVKASHRHPSSALWLMTMIGLHLTEHYQCSLLNFPCNCESMTITRFSSFIWNTCLSTYPSMPTGCKISHSAHGCTPPTERHASRITQHIIMQCLLLLCSRNSCNIGCTFYHNDNGYFTRTLLIHSTIQRIFTPSLQRCTWYLSPYFLICRSPYECCMCEMQWCVFPLSHATNNVYATIKVECIFARNYTWRRYIKSTWNAFRQVTRSDSSVWMLLDPTKPENENQLVAIITICCSKPTLRVPM